MNETKYFRVSQIKWDLKEDDGITPTQKLAGFTDDEVFVVSISTPGVPKETSKEIEKEYWEEAVLNHFSDVYGWSIDSARVREIPEKWWALYQAFFASDSDFAAESA